MMSPDTSTSDFFVAGGTLRADSPSYVQRPADEELFSLAAAGAFCYVLTARQMGKSSLMIRTARRLGAQGVRTALIDLTKIGTEVTLEQWYLGLVTRLKSQLKLTVDPEAWWTERASLGALQRFTDFLHEVVLAEIEGRVVIFIDEIDTTLNLTFSDDFFAAIRFTYNARASDPAYNRLTFVLLGVATPADLIKDRRRTPFNIGQGVDLREFSREDAQVLQRGLEAVCPEEGQALFGRIFHWTNGHPYLTQRLCLTVAERGDDQWTEERVDQVVQKLFLSEEARKETNLEFVRDSVRSSPQPGKLLSLYRQVYEGKQVPEDERSLDQNRLKLFGLVGAEGGVLQVRNEVYRQVFNLAWVRANTPVDWTRRIAVIASLVALVLASALGVYIWQQGQRTDEVLAQTYAANFQGTTNPTLRLDNLASLFNLTGFADRARALFDSLPSEEQIALFSNASPDLQPQVRTVVRGTYTYLNDTEADNRLLQAMQSALDQSEEADSVILANEIARWLEGRAAAAEGDDEAARRAYDAALDLNDQNPATHFERGLVLTALGDYPGALADFETVLRLREAWRERVRQAVVNNGQLYAALWSQQGAYPTLVALVPTPTRTATPTLTPTLAPSTATPTSLSPTNTPTRTPTPQPDAVVNIAALNLRAGPGTEYPVLGSYPRGTALRVVGKEREEAWLQVETPDGQTGWMLATYLQVNIALSSVPVVAVPPTPPDGGRIAFISDRDGQNEIYVMNVEGRGVTRLTSIRTSSRFSDWWWGRQSPAPLWSPDGTRIAFVSDVDGNDEIHVINADGSRLINLTNNQAHDTQPAWSPDGTRIAFYSDRPLGIYTLGIYLINADGNGLTSLFGRRFGLREPTWSPDGTRIAFVTEHLGNSEISVMNVDGSGETKLTNSPNTDWDPSWSPDGKHIAFVSDGQIQVMDSNGNGLKDLTSSSLVFPNRHPTWSPDGTHIAFVAFVSPTSNGEIYVVNTDGSGLTNLTNSPANDWHPTWSPDGTRIAFISNRDGNYEIYVMNVDGSEQTNLTNNPADDLYPAWSPK